MKRWMGIVLTCVVCASLLSAATYEVVRQAATQPVAAVRPRVTVDAGHGGFDGGAQAPDGTCEKDLNLAIARPLGMMLTLCGFEVTMTRTDDSALNDSGDTIRTKKVSDMNARLALYEQAQLNIAIHQNMFSVAKYHGAQVFYSENNPFSKQLASCVREEIVRSLQPDNTRELKSGNRDIFLLYKTTKPTVLVECGFLSNAEELALLKDERYQQQTAFAIACGAARYWAERGNGT